MFAEARKRLQEQRNAACLEAYRKEVKDNRPTTAQGYYLKGLVLEYDVEREGTSLVEAVECYRMASHMIHNTDEYLFLSIARALLKQGPECRPASLTYIRQASATRHTPEVDLAFARYFEIGGDFGQARKHCIKAAIKGRVAGFFELASLLRQENRKLQAFAVDVVRLLAGPFLALVLGAKSRKSFDGY